MTGRADAGSFPPVYTGDTMKKLYVKPTLTSRDKLAGVVACALVSLPTKGG